MSNTREISLTMYHILKHRGKGVENTVRRGVFLVNNTELFENVVGHGLVNYIFSIKTKTTEKAKK